MKQYNFQLLERVNKRIFEKISGDLLDYTEGRIVSWNASYDLPSVKQHLHRFGSVDLRFSTEKFLSHIQRHGMCIRFSSHVSIEGIAPQSRNRFEIILDDPEEVFEYVDEFCNSYNELFTAFQILDGIKVRFGKRANAQLRKKYNGTNKI